MTEAHERQIMWRSGKEENSEFVLVKNPLAAGARNQLEPA